MLCIKKFEHFTDYSATISSWIILLGLLKRKMELAAYLKEYYSICIN